MQSVVADSGAPQIECLELDKAFEMNQPGVADLIALEMQFLEIVQVPNVGQTLVRHPRVADPKLLKGLHVLDVPHALVIQAAIGQIQGFQVAERPQ